MRILILGSNGQLGKCLKEQILNFDYTVKLVTHSSLDISDFKKTREIILDFKPNVVINASAYTSVDKAEEEKELAYLINHASLTNIASICSDIDSALIHISTDYVFDGESDHPYTETSNTNPSGVYGKSKLMGEESIKNSNIRYLIIRSAWIFSEYGNNFMKTMIQLGAEQDELRIVSDQIGSPTYAQDLAKAVIAVLPRLVLGEVKGIFHYAGSPPCSWYEFAKFIFREAVSSDVLKVMPKITAIKTSQYPTPAKRPKNSVLDSSLYSRTFNICSSDWKKGVKKAVQSLKANHEY